MIVRNIDCKECVEAGRIVLSICVMMFWFRILHIFSVHKELGPKLVMIGRMVSSYIFLKLASCSLNSSVTSYEVELFLPLWYISLQMVDLAFFVIILMVFIIAYGVASQVILYPNSDFGLELIRDVLKKPYFQMYGELFLEEIEGTVV